MKTGILTFHNAVNYGALLQVYALQETIRNLFVNCEVLDYKSEGIEKQYRKIRFSESNSMKHFILQNLTIFFRKQKKQNFKKFVESNICLSRSFNSIKDASEYDSIVVGSDQVWNPLCTEGDCNFLLNYIGDKPRKIAYAASLGKKENIDLYKSRFGVEFEQYLKQFSWISSREQDASEYLSQLLDRNCDYVLDPTFLFGVDGWSKFVQKSKEEEYILVYNLGNFSNLFDVVKFFENKTNLKVKIINKDIKGDLKSYSYENLSCVSPDEFVSLLANARYVVTDSFHATAFSIMFHRDFYVVANSNKNNTNSRLQNILNEFGINGRYITNGSTGFSFAEDIDYSSVEQRLYKRREESISLLAKALGKKSDFEE